MNCSKRWYTSTSGPTVKAETLVALGSFDGVHSGHRDLIARTVSEAEKRGLIPAAAVFTLPPARFGTRDFEGILMEPAEKKEMLRSLGIREILPLDFAAVRDIEADVFVKEFLIGKLRAAGTVCGADFTFGKDRAGNAESLKGYFGDAAVVIDRTRHRSGDVSSSRIRKLLLSGDVLEASRLLLRPYALSGRVIPGRGDGSRFGFPTLNIAPPRRLVCPARGVYITLTELAGVTQPLPSVTDIGYAPTLDDSGKLRIESHIIDSLCPPDAGRLPPPGEDFDGVIRISFLDRLRDEMKFSSPAMLARRISADSGIAAAYFGLRGTPHAPGAAE